jgi:hypothetical protein
MGPPRLFCPCILAPPKGVGMVYSEGVGWSASALRFLLKATLLIYIKVYNERRFLKSFEKSAAGN